MDNLLDLSDLTLLCGMELAPLSEGCLAHGGTNSCRILKSYTKLVLTSPVKQKVGVGVGGMEESGCLLHSKLSKNNLKYSLKWAWEGRRRQISALEAGLIY